MNNSKSIRSLVIAATVAAASLTGSFARAENPQAVAQVDALVTVMKEVGKSVEPSVVSIDVQKRVLLTDAQRDQMRQMKDMQDRLRKMLPNGGNNGGDDATAPDEEEEPSATPDAGRLQFGEGSGVILDATPDKAYILTNNHVAGEAEKITVTLHDGRKIEEVKVLGTDPLSDLAVLEITAPNLKAVRWGNSDQIDKGDIVMAFGAPFGYVGSMTQGIVSGKNRTTNPMGGPGLLGQNAYEYFIQTDCAINPGNSGGPLVNVHGELVGINTAIASRTGGFNGIGFAVPSNLARFVYDQLKETGKVTRGYLGVGIMTSSNLPKNQLSNLKLGDRRGVWVREVRGTSPAIGKLEANDVILAVNGEPVLTSEDLRLKIAFTKPGTEVKLNVLRGGEEKQVAFAVGTFPDESQANASPKNTPAAPSSTEMGATLSDANAARLKSAGLPDGSKGALVTGIKAGSPAQMAGLEVGDLITKVNDTDVASAEEAVKAVKAGKLADGISFMVTSKTGTKSVFVQVAE